jgi:adenylate cyclase
MQMSSSRQLAAIMFTDIEGYSAMMQQSEQKAILIKDRHREILQKEHKKFNGRIIHYYGDGTVSVFQSAVQAVRCALAMQQEFCQPPEVPVRIGLHIGDIVFDEEQVFGDGVNLASRIESLGISGCVLLSDRVNEEINNHPELKTVSVGIYQFKNIARMVEVFALDHDGLVIPKPGSLTGKTEEKKNTLQQKTGKPASKSVAVLPFLNLSNDPEQEHFCDGIAEEIINALAQLNNLRVIARTSVFALKNKHLDVSEIGKLLDVRTLLEGSVRKAGDRVRITTKLVDVSDGSHLWSENYDRVLEDIFAIQDDIAQKVATALRGVLTEKEKQTIRRPETSPEAYDYYLKGRQLLHGLVLNAAKIEFEKAIELDAGYAPAYTGLADLHSWLYEWEGAKNDDLEAADRYSHTAMTLAPNLAESHSSRGYVLSLANKYDEAGREFNEAIGLNPNSFDAYYYYGRSCFASGQIEQSAKLFQKAAEVRLEDFQSMLLLGQSLNMLERDSGKPARLEGIRRARKQLELDPTDKRALSLAPVSMLEVGQAEEALQLIHQALNLYPKDVVVLINAACFFARSGEKKKALDVLEKVFGKGFGKKDWIEHDPDYDSLRDEPRFQALLNKLQ